MRFGGQALPSGEMGKASYDGRGATHGRVRLKITTFNTHGEQTKTGSQDSRAGC
jgi:hypothetical protein